MVAFKKFTRVIMLAALLKLIGCSERRTTEIDTRKDSLNAQIDQSIEDFKNRSIHKVLTTQIIDTTSDDNLLQTVCDNLTQKLPSDYNDEYNAVTSWNKPQQAIYLIMNLEGQVNNGGFNQYYYNSDGQYAQLLPDLLRLVGAEKLAELTNQANETYKNENIKVRHADRTSEGFSKSYENNPLSKMDDKFYELNKDETLDTILIQFIRKNKQYFID
jgi:hypothetical protein